MSDITKEDLKKIKDKEKKIIMAWKLWQKEHKKAIEMIEKVVRESLPEWIARAAMMLGIRNPLYEDFVCEGKDLLKLAEILPEDVLNGRHNSAPTFHDFVEVAKKYPDLRVEGYIKCFDKDLCLVGAVGSKKAIVELIDRAEDIPDELEKRSPNLVRAWWD